MKKRLIKIIDNIDKNIYILFFINLFIFMPFISKRYVFGHDTLYHIAQIDSITKSLFNLNFTKISSVIGNEFGYAPAIFYPKLPHYICVLINIFTNKFNVIYSINIYFILISNLISIFMYKLLLELTNNKKASLLGSIFYITMPYYISDIFIRSALNEFLIFLFMPIILIGIINLLKGNIKKFYIYFIIGYIGFINSHLVLCVYFTILLLVLMLFNYKDYINKIKHLLISSLIIIIYTLPNIILLLEHKLLNIYVVFNEKLMELSYKTVQIRGLSILDLLYPRRTDIYKFINIIVLIFLVLGIYNIIKNKKNKTLYGIITFTIISILLSLKIFPYNILPKLLLSIQFAFRNCCFIIFGISIISSYGVLMIKDKYLDKVIYLSVIICLIISSFYTNKALFKDISIEESNYDIYAGIGWNREYLPVNTFNNIEYFLNRDNEIHIDTESNIEVLKTYFPSIKFNITNSNNTTVEIPRLYYLGYKVREKINNKYIDIDYRYNKNGFIEFDIEKDGEVEINWIGTPLYNIVRIFRIIFTLTLLIIFINRKKK